MFDLTPPWQEVLNYWFEDGLERGWPSQPAVRKWFRSTAGDDAEIEHRFAMLVESALRQELVEWERQPLSRLALILLLDQFTRNIYRRQARAFAGDHRAATLAVEGLSRQMNNALPPCGQVFFIMPLMHAEDEDLQLLCLEAMQTLQAGVPDAISKYIDGHIKAAREHLEIIRQFGRFPHRNAALGRESTEKEMIFLSRHSSFGQ